MFYLQLNSNSFSKFLFESEINISPLRLSIIAFEPREWFFGKSTIAWLSSKLKQKRPAFEQNSMNLLINSDNSSVLASSDDFWVRSWKAKELNHVS